MLDSAGRDRRGTTFEEQWGNTMKLTKIIMLVTGTGALVLAGSPPAGADPSKEVFQIDCGSSSYVVEGNGNGEWTPVRDTASTRVFVPTSFGDFSVVIRDENGTLVDSFTEEGTTLKGSGARDRKGDVISCTFEFSDVSDGSDPEFPAGYSFTGTGEVTGFVAGGH